MSKKVFWVIMIPALLLIGGYIALQVFLRHGAGENNQKAAAQSSSSGSNKSTESNAAQRGEENKTALTSKKEPEVGTTSKKDTLSSANTSPLDLRPLFIEKMQQLVKKSSNGLYNLSVRELKVDVLASRVSLHSVRLQPDAAVLQGLKKNGLLPENVINASFESLLIDGVNLDDAINSKSMDYKLVKLVNPQIEIELLKKSKKKSSEDFSQRFLKEMDKLAIGRIEVDGGNITVHDKTKGSTKRLKQVQVRLQDILLNEQTRKDKNRFLFAKGAKLDFQDFSMKSADGVYDFKIGNVAVDATQKQVVLKKLTYGSELTKEAFSKKQKTAKEMYNLVLPMVTLNGVDWWPALNGEEVAANEVVLNGGHVSIYLDRALPPESKMGKFVNQMLAKLPLKVDVDKLKIRDLDIAYEEKSKLSEQSGTIYFDNTTMNITRINNKKSNTRPMVMNASTLFMKEVPVKAVLTFDMEKPEAGNFTADLELDGFDGSLVNSFAKPLGLVKIERGEIKHVKANIRGNELAATGNVQISYDKLKISMWKKKQGEEDLKKKHLMSFVANVFAIKNSNPWWLDNKFRQKSPEFKRDSTDSFMALLWKTMFTGILKTAGAPPKAAKGKK